MKITRENWMELKKDMQAFYLAEIRKRVAASGGMEPLSKLLGHAATYVQVILTRGAFSALERLYKECEEKLDKNTCL